MTVDVPSTTDAVPAEEIEPILKVRSEPGVAKPDPILTLHGVSRSFGGLVAVDVDHLEVQRGVVTSLIGPNGAGKSTLFNLLTGFDRADRGRWTFAGQLVSGMSADRLARRGMVRTFQLTKSLAKLPVIENMLLGAPDQTGERLWAAPFRSRWRDQERDNTERAEQLLEQFNLAHMRDELAGTLSGGQRKLLAWIHRLVFGECVIRGLGSGGGVSRRVWCVGACRVGVGGWVGLVALGCVLGVPAPGGWVFR